MPESMAAIRSRADNLGLSIIAGRGDGRQGKYKVFAARGVEEWYESSLIMLKSKRELEAFLDGFLIASRNAEEV